MNIHMTAQKFHRSFWLDARGYSTTTTHYGFFDRLKKQLLPYFTTIVISLLQNHYVVVKAIEMSCDVMVLQL